MCLSNLRSGSLGQNLLEFPSKSCGFLLCRLVADRLNVTVSMIGVVMREHNQRMKTQACWKVRNLEPSRLYFEIIPSADALIRHQCVNRINLINFAHLVGKISLRRGFKSALVVVKTKKSLFVVPLKCHISSKRQAMKPKLQALIKNIVQE